MSQRLPQPADNSRPLPTAISTPRANRGVVASSRKKRSTPKRTLFVTTLCRLANLWPFLPMNGCVREVIRVALLKLWGAGNDAGLMGLHGRLNPCKHVGVCSGDVAFLRGVVAEVKE